MPVHAEFVLLTWVHCFERYSINGRAKFGLLLFCVFFAIWNFFPLLLICSNFVKFFQFVMHFPIFYIFSNLVYVSNLVYLFQSGTYRHWFRYLKNIQRILRIRRSRYFLVLSGTCRELIRCFSNTIPFFQSYF